MIAEKHFAARQTSGARSSQEDAYAFSGMTNGNGESEGLLVAVADGMGGHSAGEHASRLAVKTFVDTFRRTKGAISDRFSIGLEAANGAIKNELQRDPALQGMGCTLVAASITAAGFQWISVGDSPVYLLRGSTLQRLNADHSLRPILKELAERGEVPTQPSSASGSILQSAITGEEIAMIDQSPAAISLQNGDLILVATDGIHTLNNQEIIATCADSDGLDASVLADALLQAVVNADNPKQDNVTVAIIKAGPANG